MTWHNKLRWYHRSLIVLAVGLIYFGGSTFAQSNTPIMPGLLEDGIRVGYDQGGLKGFTETAEQGLKMLYLILWPLLAVAAAAMDNSLVYGNAFYLTNALFKFRQIIRTFANFTIGLYFVGSILAAFFGNKLENVFSGLLKNVAIAAILVNMSRWIIAALIDLSTLATVTLGALPLHALGNDTVFKDNVYFMKTYSNLNLDASTSQKADTYDFSIMYGCTQGEGDQAYKRYYLPCAVNDRKLFYQGAEGEPLTREQYKADFVNVRKNDTKIDTNDISDAYCVYDKQIIRNDYGTDISKCKELQRVMVDGKEEGISMCATVDQILTKSVNMSGPLFTIFSSILNMSEMGLTTNSGSIKEVSMNLLIKLVFGIALIIPLIALAVVMVIRVVYLWLIIAFSPLITIAIALQWGDKMEGKIDNILSNMLKPTQIISLIFLPVIAVFGLSISIIFLSLLRTLPLIEENVGRTESAIEADDGCYNDPVTALGMQRDETDQGTVYYVGPTKVTISKSLRETGADIGNMMSWLVINFFGIALMRMVVFATLKTNNFTEGVAETIDSAAKEFMGTVPLPLAGGIGLTKLKETPQLIRDKVVGDRLHEQDELLQEFSASYDSDTKALNDTLTAGQQNPSALPGLNQNSVPPRTDFLSDYQAGGKAYAQKAKSYFYDDKTKQLTKAGASYAATRYTPEQIQNGSAASDITSSLDKVTTWNDALANQEFVHWMHDSEEEGYDKFLKTRDRRTNPSTNTVKAMEDGLLKITETGGQHGEKLIGNKNTHWYMYDNNSKLTTFDRDQNNKKFTGKSPVSYSIDNTLTEGKLKDKDVSLFNLMMLLGQEHFNTSAFFKLFSKDKIKISGDKEYTATKDEQGNIISFDPTVAPQE